MNVLCDPVQYKRNEKVHGRLATPFVKLQTNAAVLQNLMRQWLNTLKISHNAVLAHICMSKQNTGSSTQDSTIEPIKVDFDENLKTINK